VHPHHRARPASTGTAKTDIALAGIDADGAAALAELASVLRTNDYCGQPDHGDPTVEACFRLGVGAQADRARVSEVVGPDALSAMVAAGWAEYGDLDPSFVRLTMSVFPTASLLTVIPRPAADRDTVYIGPDSLQLFRVAWQAGGGGRAVDLATGNGFLAAALATRFERVVAADLAARCVAAAALVPVLNPFLASRIGVIQADIADGLAPRSFDLVTANPPWVPEPFDHAGSPARRFAAGGPTGFELPRRFLDAAADLLAPGGRAFVSCLDIEFPSGRRPLRDHIPELEAAGCEVELHRATLPGYDDVRGWVKDRLGRVPSARFVIVELRAPR
jgi:methylase of polypeptide subunit release factors